jgi:hypothetical protein
MFQTTTCDSSDSENENRPLLLIKSKEHMIHAKTPRTRDVFINLRFINCNSKIAIQFEKVVYLSLLK